MDATGPTGTSVDELLNSINTGATGISLAEYNMLINPPMTGPTGPTGYMMMFPSADMGTTPAPLVVDISELLASYGAVQSQETIDRTKISVLLNETRETLRPQMFTWAAAGFPSVYIIQQFQLAPPSVCSDGVARSVSEYVPYLLGQDMAATIAAIQAMCTGVQISYSFQENTLRIHVTKS
jgi:hypothetical protein